MRGKIYYKFRGGLFPYAAILESEAYAHGVEARGASYIEARTNLIETLLSSASDEHIPFDEEIEF